MLTVIESPLFQKLWPLYWSEEERGEFAAFIALEPTAGVVIRESGGLRKVRWTLRTIDKDFADRCFLKGSYWLEPDTWDKKKIEDTGIAIDAALEATRQFLIR